MKFWSFLGKFFSPHLPPKLLAIVLAVAAVIVINAI